MAGNQTEVRGNTTELQQGPTQKKAIASDGIEMAPKYENYTVTKTENNRYKVTYGGVELAPSLATKENVSNFIFMTEQALVQYDSCMAQKGLLESVRKHFADCSFNTEEKVLSGMNITINDSVLTKTSVIDEDQFRKALERIVKKRGQEHIIGIQSQDELYYFWNEFVRFVEAIAKTKSTMAKRKSTPPAMAKN